MKGVLSVEHARVYSALFIWHNFSCSLVIPACVGMTVRRTQIPPHKQGKNRLSLAYAADSVCFCANVDFTVRNFAPTICRTVRS